MEYDQKQKDGRKQADQGGLGSECVKIDFLPDQDSAIYGIDIGEHQYEHQEIPVLVYFFK